MFVEWIRQQGWRSDERIFLKACLLYLSLFFFLTVSEFCNSQPPFLAPESVSHWPTDRGTRDHSPGWCHPQRDRNAVSQSTGPFPTKCRLPSHQTQHQPPPTYGPALMSLVPLPQHHNRSHLPLGFPTWRTQHKSYGARMSGPIGGMEGKWKPNG